MKGLEVWPKIKWGKETLTNEYGEFTLEPLERGYGHSIGNSLRRVLLSSLKGAAVTYVRIEGVLHEFSTIPGVVEDTAQIILNLKKLLLKLHTDKPKVLYIKSKKEGKLTARDIITDSETEILNPDLHIATLSKNAKLEMEMGTEIGNSYVSAEENKKEGQPIGVIPIDSLFSPVKRLSYEVKNARVKQITNYDKLIMKIWTDGTINPEDAVAQSADTLRKQLLVFINFSVEEPEIKTKKKKSKESEEKKKRREENLAKNVEELGLPIRSSNCLKMARIKKMEELTHISEDELLKVKNFGKKSLREIKDKLAELGLSLKEKQNSAHK